MDDVRAVTGALPRRPELRNPGLDGDPGDLRRPHHLADRPLVLADRGLVAIFAFGVARLVLKYRRGRRTETRRQAAPAGCPRRAIVFTHSWIRRRDPLSGLAHLFVFYGFLVLFVGTAILAFQDDFAEPRPRLRLLDGWFYLGYSLFLDVFGVTLVVGLTLLAVKRGALRPFRLSYWRPADPAPELAGEARRYRIGDWAFVGSLFFLALSGFLLECVPDRRDRSGFEKWSPFGWLIGQAFIAIGLDGATADSARAVDWWVHGVFALFWVSSIPFTKAVHMIAGPAGVAVKDDRAGSRLAPLARRREVRGRRLRDDRRALAEAPARPRRVHEVRQVPRGLSCDRVGLPALAARPRPRPARGRGGLDGKPRRPGHRPEVPEHAQILGTIKPETLWSCMQCMACVEICPVGIEHVPIINQMRRALVERGELDSQLQSTLETIYTSGNSFGEAKRKRARWAKELDFGVKDIRKEQAQYLWFVGDYASFDPRNAAITQALARVLRDAEGRLRDPLRRREDRRERRPPGRRGRALDVARRGEHRHDLRLLVRDDPDARPALLQHAQERVPGPRRQLAGAAPLGAPSRPARVGPAPPPPRARLPRHVPRPLHARALQRRVRAAAASCSRRSAASSSRCPGIATTRSAAARAVGGSG